MDNHGCVPPCWNCFYVLFGEDFSAKSVPWCPQCSLERREAKNPLTLLYECLQKQPFLWKTASQLIHVWFLGLVDTVTWRLVICCSWNWILQISQLSNMIMYGIFSHVWTTGCLINLCNMTFSSARNMVLVLIPESTNNQCSGQDSFLRKFKSLIEVGQRREFSHSWWPRWLWLSALPSVWLHAEDYFNDRSWELSWEADLIGLSPAACCGSALDGSLLTVV